MFASKLEQIRIVEEDTIVPRINVIGEDGGTLRVLNFSGGGFESVLQLGVTHALLVNQGKAPDIVVGVSAGGIQAAALAETLRAGVLPDGSVSVEEYEKVMGKRVARFREFSDACFNSPKSIVDAVMPDAYQIDSSEPLAAMRLPRLAKEERDEREKWTSRKTGLVRLYNDLLSIDLPFGTLTRLVRRILGYRSANAIANRLKRLVVKIIELMRFWLVLGTELRRLAPAVPILFRPLAGKSKAVRHSTAGSIIFRFRPVDVVWKFLNWFWSFSVLLSFWVAISWTAALLPFLAVMGLSDGDNSSWYVNIFYILYLLPIILPLTPVAVAYDRTKLRNAIRDLSKGMFVFLYYLLKWTVVLVLLLFVVFTLFGLVVGLFQQADSIVPVDPVMSRTPLANDQFDEFRAVMFWVPIALIAIQVLSWLPFTVISYFRSKRREKLGFMRWYRRRFLDSYGIGSALAENYNLKRLLVGLFDPDYYGSLPISKVLSDSMKDVETEGFVPPRRPRRKPLSTYRECRTKRDKPIIVALTAADVGSGNMVVLPETCSVIDGLLASTAAVPVFPAIELSGKVLIDAVDVGNNPTKALVELFQQNGLAEVSDVHIYPVESLPISSDELGPSPRYGDRPYEDLLEIVGRAVQLQKYRDATVDRLLTQVLSDTLPEGRGTVTVPHEGKNRTYFRANFAPIELEHATGINRKVLFGDKESRRQTIGETIASGCRASLEVMHRQVIADLYESRKKAWLEEQEVGSSEDDFPKYLRCKDVMEEVRSRRPQGIPDVRLPGSGSDAPGIAEICHFCRICNSSGEVIAKDAVQCLSVRSAISNERSSTDTTSTPAEPVPDWPHELEPSAPQKEVAPAVTPTDESKLNSDEAYPSVACLFSGGVFRGVFQMGVLNALSMLEARPKIVAGASVGSITAAMVAAALSRKDPRERSLLVAQLASVYIGIDRIILTDRFADFIRNWTIRASETKFSLRQMDQVFRKYDEQRGKIFQRDMRQVLAGLERLFYINPYQVNKIIKAVRVRSGFGASELVKTNIQEWLDRMEVGEEVLGAEPIQLLIEEFVVPSAYDCEPSAAPFDCIDDDLTFLATATNLTKGRLEILPQVHGDTTLTEGLLASSAFPGVFRPRRSWDLHPGTEDMDQFIDGGVMDNLPLAPVLDTMRAMADREELPLRSRHGPHLMLSASLEVDPRGLGRKELHSMARYWPELRSRARELKYNTKLDNFDRVTSSMQSIYAGAGVMREPMRVKVLAVKPKWLCSTFAFHPMLGFRRKKQIQSIAHGCAATLLAFGGEFENVAGWRMNQACVPPMDSFDEALARLAKLKTKKRDAGHCWLREGVNCPFSRQELDRVAGDELDDHSKKWLSRIHRSCWERQTHIRQ